MKQTDKKYWFKRRRFGWGYTPVTWQGWLSLLAPIAILIASAYWILPAKPEQPTLSQHLLFLGAVVLDLLVILGITMAKGPSPKWRWGKKHDDNPDEDF